jgi:outer membrane protein assembly factor BamE (lipoprotein component of BamABCDE complex)
VQFAIAVVILAVVKGVFSAGDRSRTPTSDYSPLHTQPGQGYQAPQLAMLKPQPKNRQRLSVGQIVELHREALKRRPDLQMSVQEFSRFMQANQSDYDFSEGIPYSPPTPVGEQPAAAGSSERFAQEAVAAPNTRLEDIKKVDAAPVSTHDPIVAAPSNPNSGFFTVGSTKDEVLAVQGEPHKFTDSTFTYGASQVRFKDGKVESWSDTGYSKLKAKLLPAGQVEARDYFTVGSTRDEVLAIQGTPDRISRGEFAYGTSTVQLKDGKVVSWSQGYPELKAQMVPTTGVAAKDYFTVGSTKDEVLAVQGKPDRSSRRQLTYGSSTIQLKDGKVFSWDQHFPRLKARLLPTAEVATKGFITVGSTKDEVLAVLGTPDRFSDRRFTYGTATIRFQGDRVTSWNGGHPKLERE